MKKENSWKIYSHNCRNMYKRPTLSEYKLWKEDFDNLLQFHPTLVKIVSEKKKMMIHSKINISSREISFRVALEQSKINQDERDTIVHEVVDRMKQMTNEQLLNLQLKYKYELSYLAHAADMQSTRLQAVSLELAARQEFHRKPQIMTFRYYGSKGHAIGGLLRREKIRWEKKEQKKAKVTIEFNVVQEMFNQVLEGK